MEFFTRVIKAFREWALALAIPHHEIKRLWRKGRSHVLLLLLLFIACSAKPGECWGVLGEKFSRREREKEREGANLKYSTSTPRKHVSSSSLLLGWLDKLRDGLWAFRGSYAASSSLPPWTRKRYRVCLFRFRINSWLLLLMPSWCREIEQIEMKERKAEGAGGKLTVKVTERRAREYIEPRLKNRIEDIIR